MNRTDKQNNSIHLALRNTAKLMDDGGITQRVVWDKLNQSFDLPVTEHTMKELFSVICGSLHGEERTHKLSTTETIQAWDVFQQVISERFGIYVEYPSNEPPLLKEY